VTVPLSGERGACSIERAPPQVVELEAVGEHKEGEQWGWKLIEHPNGVSSKAHKALQTRRSGGGGSRQVRCNQPGERGAMTGKKGGFKKRVACGNEYRQSKAWQMKTRIARGRKISKKATKEGGGENPYGKRPDSQKRTSPQKKFCLKESLRIHSPITSSPHDSAG